MPGSGGEVRTYFFLKMLAEFGDLTLISLGGPGGDRQVGEDLRELCHRVVQSGPKKTTTASSTPRKGRLASWIATLGVLLFPWRQDWRPFYRYCAQYLAPAQDSQPTTAGKRAIQFVLRTQYQIGATLGIMPTRAVLNYAPHFDAVKADALKALNESEYDIVWYEHTTSFPFIKSLLNSAGKQKVHLVCNAHNIESCLYARMADVATGWEATYNRLQSGLLRKIEVEQFRKCQLVLTCSDADRDLGGTMAAATRFKTIGNGVDTTYFAKRPMDRKTKSPTILFTGTFGYGPNRDGLQYFVDDILPGIREKLDANFVFAGYDAQRAYDDLKIEADYIRCVSSPADIRPCFDEAWVFVVPLRAGSGTRLKILEAMSMGCPIVSTSLGAEGIASESTPQISIADDPTEFADSVVELLNNRKRRLEMRNAASEWVQTRFSWDLLCERAKKELKTMVPR